jgi:hypothetical protein
MAIQVGARQAIDDVSGKDSIAYSGIVKGWAAICQIGPGGESYD